MTFPTGLRFYRPDRVRLRCRAVDPAAQRAQSFNNLLLFLRQDVLRYSPYYRQKFSTLDIALDSIETERDFAAKIPFTEKDELRAHYPDFVLRPNWPGLTADPRVEEIDAERFAEYRERAQAAENDAGDIERPSSLDERTYRQFLYDWQPILPMRTGGTTGTAAQSSFTLWDIHGPLRRAGLFHHNFSTWTPTQRYMSLLPAGEHLGFYGNFLVPLLNGQPLRPMFGGRVISTEDQVLVAHREKIQALFGTSSYLTTWLDTACRLADAGRIDGLPSLQMISASAEALSEGYVARIRASLARLGAPNARLLQGLSSTELKSGGFRECDEGTGLHVDPQHFFIELIDPDTRRPAAPGKPGVLVWSHIDWHGTVIIRYWSGDMIDGGARFDRCPCCGLTVPRLFPPFRRLVADFIKVRGARVDLAELRAAIETLLPRDTYQIEIRTQDNGRHIVSAWLQGSPESVPVDGFREIVMRTVELRLDEIRFCSAQEMQYRLYGGGGWKPRWLIHE